eukprot:CAMPEP_0115215480 /NCGR_PEP_ID=MMETSP0270-20121206/24839_1 /TAXON_ID=71861 /ORGANISM="Scrippsiella trochoidea, Strain CCMP3099" /LENGTH=262 /DNA_ID=CAMNT_0002629277 /DNA_START=196 /DNA_END=984 /DNA_ORIENTATION=-
MTMGATDVASDLQDSCEISSIAMLISLSFVGLVVAFFGYRLYRTFLALLGFVFFSAIEGAFGLFWIQQATGADVQKKLVVLLCCLVWGVLGALFCVRHAERLQRKLGFMLGVVFGIVLVCGTIYAVKEDVDAQLGHHYKGWDIFALSTFGLPIGLMCGYLLRSRFRPALMLATALGGAALAVRPLAAVLAPGGCLGAEGFGAGAGQKAQAAIVAALAALAFCVQLCTDPERRRGGRKAAAEAPGGAPKPAAQPEVTLFPGDA